MLRSNGREKDKNNILLLSSISCETIKEIKSSEEMKDRFLDLKVVSMKNLTRRNCASSLGTARILQH